MADVEDGENLTNDALFEKLICKITSVQSDSKHYKKLKRWCDNEVKATTSSRKIRDEIKKKLDTLTWRIYTHANFEKATFFGASVKRYFEKIDSTNHPDLWLDAADFLLELCETPLRGNNRPTINRATERRDSLDVDDLYKDLPTLLQGITAAENIDLDDTRKDIICNDAASIHSGSQNERLVASSSTGFDEGFASTGPSPDTSQLFADDPWKRLTSTIQRPYWCTEFSHSSATKNLYSDARCNEDVTKFEAFMLMCGLEGPRALVINERSIYFELLWLLLSKNGTTYFSADGLILQPFKFSHLTAPIAMQLVQPLLEFGRTLASIRRTVDDFQWHNSGFTLRAFMAAVVSQLEPIDSELVRLRKMFKSSPATLLRLRRDVLKLSLRVRRISDVVARVLDCPYTDSCQKALWILSTLQTTITELSILEDTSVLEAIFTKAAQPYLGSLEEFILTGQCSNGFDELCFDMDLVRKPQKSSKYWNESYALRDISKQLLVFFRPIMKDILLAGKCLYVDRLNRQIALVHCAVEKYDLAGDFTRVLQDGGSGDLFSVRLERALHVTLKSFCTSVATQFMTSLRNHCEPGEAIAYAQGFFLMFDGDKMFRFTSEIFAKISAGERWQNLGFLYCAFEDVCQSQEWSLHLESESGTSASKNSTPASKNSTPASTGSGSTSTSRRSSSGGTSGYQDPISSLDALKLRYEVAWPQCTLFTDSMFIAYNMAFNALLKLRCARYLHSRTIFKSGDVHSIALLKFRISSLLASLDTALTGAVVCITHDMLAQLKEAKDIHVAMRIHTRSLMQIHSHLFLAPDTHVLAKPLQRFYNHVLALNALSGSSVLAHYPMLLQRYRTVESVADAFSTNVIVVASVLERFLERGIITHHAELVDSLRIIQNCPPIRFEPVPVARPQTARRARPVSTFM